MEEYRLWKMTWPEIAERLNITDIVLIPVGSIEQHGHHMPIDTDVFISTRICELCAKACQKEDIWIPVGSPINYAVSWYHMNFPGTVDIPQRLFIDYVISICRSFYKHGFKKIVLVNSHGGNSGALTVVSNLLHQEFGHRVYTARWREMAGDIVKDIETGGIHADQVETAVAIALGQRVKMDLSTNEAFDRHKVLSKSGDAVSQVVKYDAHHKGPFVNVSMDYIDKISKSGVVGDATKATKELGEKIISNTIKHLKKLCIDLNIK